ncbi:type II toxin-antitoxin system antitoxin SocA domain-containing protein [Ochrobactrum sp. CGA5]|uniref:Panacea domain-containing protein n=1 Tax=Ochrobactrum sp. CGA5 TaxID=2583453 RepID=UPI0011247EA2|nr:type II toxin-antitoxin system antitoxin SocA domain-containing protein [Ochrobactrum sp. CGA5]
MFEPGVNNASDLLADYLLAEMRERGEILTPLKLQKMMFYADAWHLALYDREITGEKFKAWVHGPVLISQYHRFKDFRWMPITTEIKTPEISPELKAHLDEIVEIFGSETAVALERMTHKETPWIEARGDLPDDEPCDNYISKKTTAEYYRNLGKDN